MNRVDRHRRKHTHTDREGQWEMGGVVRMGGAVVDGRDTGRWEGQWGIGRAVGDGRSSSGWMGGTVGDGRGSRRWEGQCQLGRAVVSGRSSKRWEGE